LYDATLVLERHVSGRARAIAVPVERLLQTRVPSPIARGLRVLAAVASDFSLSRFHFCHAFKESTELFPSCLAEPTGLEQAMKNAA
jgi:AraC-like DNA-binding protein